jgi:hypothetical protein
MTARSEVHVTVAGSPRSSEPVFGAHCIGGHRIRFHDGMVHQ